MLFLKRILALLISTLFFKNVMTFTIEDINRLISDKKKDYNKKLRPVFHQNQTLDVFIQMELITIQDFDEVSGKFIVGAILLTGWQDELIQWNPAQYGGMRSFTSEDGDFWRPPIVLVNPHENFEKIGYDWDVMRYTEQGRVFVTPGAILEASCVADVSYYPWDEHDCPLIFYVWGYRSDEVSISCPKDRVGTSIYQGNGLWDIVTTRVYCTIDISRTPVAVFNIKIKRKPGFILVNIILPVTIMSFMNMLVFWIPTDSGERISYCLTVLLALAVFLTIVGDNLPKTSNPVPYISYYLLSMLVLSVGIVLATAFSLRLYFTDESKPVPKCIAAIVCCITCRCKQKRKREESRQSSYKRQSQDLDTWKYNGYKAQRHIPLYKPHIIPLQPSYRDNSDIRKSPDGDSQLTKRNKKIKDLSDYEEDQGVKVIWKDVSNVVDILFFLLFMGVLIIFTTFYFVMIQNSAA